MCRNIIPQDTVIAGVMIREEKGYRLFTAFNTDKRAVEAIFKNFKKLGLRPKKIHGKWKTIRRRIKKSNLKRGLPGVGLIPA